MQNPEEVVKALIRVALFGHKSPEDVKTLTDFLEASKPEEITDEVIFEPSGSEEISPI